MPFTNYYYINVGDLFGSWLVLEINQPHSRSLVRCICGIERLIRTADLVTGRSRSCGKKICGADYSNIKGMKFGFLVVLEMTDLRASNGSIIWKCKCCCDSILNVPSKRLISGVTKSCGCRRYYIRNKSTGLLSEEDRAINIILDRYVRGAKDRNLNWCLSREEFKNLIEQNCFYCRSPPDKTISLKRLDNAINYKFSGIYRINSDQGYNISNCVPCCWICNRAKLDSDLNDFLSWIEKIHFNFLNIKEKLNIK